jgi:hypothetical protein
MVTAHLGRRLAHDDARHERHPWHVAADPKLIVRNVLVPDDDASLDVIEYDGCELLHLVPLRVDAADFLDISHDAIEVVLREINDQVFRWHNQLR